MPASAERVEAVITAESQLRPLAATTIVPELLTVLFCTIPLIILSYNLLSYYALYEYPAPAGWYLAVPTPATSVATTPVLETKLDIETLPPEPP